MVDREAADDGSGWRQTPWPVAVMYLVSRCINFLMGNWLRYLIGSFVCVGVVALIVGVNPTAGFLGLGLWFAMGCFLSILQWLLKRPFMKAVARHCPELAELVQQFDDREREIRRRERWA